MLIIIKGQNPHFDARMFDLLNESTDIMVNRFSKLVQTSKKIQIKTAAKVIGLNPNQFRKLMKDNPEYSRIVNFDNKYMYIDPKNLQNFIEYLNSEFLQWEETRKSIGKKV